MDTEKIRQSYAPERIRLLLIGESPPVSGEFFYVKSNMTTYTSRAFKRAHGITFKDNAEFLKYFMNCGCFLDDLCHKPVDKLPNNEREKELKRCIIPLSERIRKFNPPVIAIVLKKIETYVREAINKSGCTPEIYVLPFPGNGWQNKYFAGLSEIILKHLPKI